MKGERTMSHAPSRPQRFHRHEPRARQVLQAACEPLERRALLSLGEVGSEFRVNAFTTSDQSTAAIAADADGDFVVAWNSYAQDGSSFGIFARRYNATGVPRGADFRVNTFTTGEQRFPAVAMDADGDFVVVWDSAQDGSNTGIFAQRYNAAGVAQGGEFRVNTFTTGHQLVPKVAMDFGGDFVVTWQSLYQDGSSDGVYAQRYDALGTPRGGEFQVNTYTTGSQRNPALAMDASGDLVITWSGNGAGDDSGVGAQRYNALGVAQGGEFHVNTVTTGSQTNPTVAMDASGDFVVAFRGVAYDIFAQRYNAAGIAQGSEFLVNTFTTGLQDSPAVAIDAGGNFLVTWGSGFADIEVSAQSFNAAGVPQGAEFRVNTFTTNLQYNAAVTMDSDGDAVVAWTSSGQDGSGSGIYAQRYIESNPDTAAPVIGGVFVSGEPVPPYALLNAPLQQIMVTFSENVASANVPSSWVLTRDGADVTGQIASFAYAVNPSSGRVEVTLNLAAPYASGNFNLTARDTITDQSGNALDGDLDGAPGGSVALPFTVAPNGPQNEFRVNTFTTTAPLFLQDRPDVGTDTEGNFIVVWESIQDGPGPQPGFQIYAQRYNAEGVRQGGEFRVNQFTTLYGSNPDIAVEPDGDFVVAWASYDDVGAGNSGIRARRFNAAGVAQGVEMSVNTYTLNGQLEPTVAVDGTGNFVVAWMSSGQDGSGNGIYAQRYNSAGGAQGPEFRVNQVTFDNQVAPDAGMDGNGDFVITWESVGQDGSSGGIYARRYNSFGTAQGAEVRVNSYTTGLQWQSKVDMNPSGSFIVTWSSQAQDGEGFGVYAQRYTATGFPLGGEFRVNTYTQSDQGSPDVALEDGGSFVVTWESDGQDGDDLGVFAQRFTSAGLPRGGEFRVNAHTTIGQLKPAVALQPQGDFVVAWSGAGPLGKGIYAARFINETLPTVGTFTDSPDPITPGDQLTLAASGVSDDGTVTGVAFYRETNGVAGLQVGFQGDAHLVTQTQVVGGVWTVMIPTAGLSGTYTYWAQATDDSGLAGASASTTNTVIPIAPVVNSWGFQYATLPQRIAYQFNQDVSASLGLDDIVVQLLPGGPTVTPSGLSYHAPTNTATFTFNAPLPDGRYRARLIASGINGPGGPPMAADHTFEFTFLRGDANGDGRVNLADFNVLAANFGQSNRNYTQGDFDYSGNVNLNDFNILASRFGQSVAAPGNDRGDDDAPLDQLA